MQICAPEIHGMDIGNGKYCSKNVLLCQQAHTELKMVFQLKFHHQFANLV